MSNARNIGKLGTLASHIANLIGLSNNKANIDAAVSGSGVSPFPSGSILIHAAAAAPSGWLLAQGQAVSRTTYATLFNAIGTSYNTGGEAGTDFRLPDLRGRTVAGVGGSTAGRLTAAGAGINGDTLGATGGAETHTITTAQMPNHGHPFRTRSDTIGSPSASTTGGFLMNNNASGLANRAAFTGTPSDTNGEQIGGTGGGQAHNNTQPTIVLNYIIKT